MLRYLESKNPPILPNVDGANYARKNGNLVILEHLKSRNPPILPTLQTDEDDESEDDEKDEEDESEGKTVSTFAGNLLTC
jgi:hypothetical protein